MDMNGEQKAKQAEVNVNQIIRDRDAETSESLVQGNEPERAKGGSELNHGTQGLIASQYETVEKPSLEDKAAMSSDVSFVKFRSRKRSRKMRMKRRGDTNKHVDSEGDSEKELTRSELFLMKEAQNMREKSHRTTLDIRVTKADDHIHDKDDGGPPASGDDVIGGLKDSFSVERSGIAVEARMDKFIEEGMRQKFGESYTAGDSDANKNSAENDLYAIPERLQVRQRPSYDPGEGLPAAGLEEVDLPQEARERNIADTVRAHKELLSSRRSREPKSSNPTLSGNLSANFIKHRNDWISDHVTARETNQKGAQDEGKSVPREIARNQDTGMENIEGTKRRKHYQMATDNVIADRFRKRWKR